MLFAAQDVLDLVIIDYVAFAADTTEAQRIMHREMRKKDHKALFYIISVSI